MEFKKPNRPIRGQPGQDIVRGGRSVIGPRAVQPPPTRHAQTNNPPEPTPHVTTPAKSPKPTARSFVRRFLSIKKNIALTAVIVIGVVLFAAALVRSTTATTSGGNARASTDTPGYQTILPTGKSISQLGGWRRISPSGNDAVFAYTDAIDGVSISVSQQPLPKSFAGNVGSQIAELAKKFNATTKIDAGDTVVYIGTSAKGPQSAIFAKNNLLILIKSQKKINTDAWKNYVKTLG